MKGEYKNTKSGT